MAPVGPIFFDTSVLVADLIELRPEPDPAQQLLTEIAEGRLGRPYTAWHCCLEFFAVSTRLPKPYRLSPRDALLLLEEEILARFDVHSLPADLRRGFLAVMAHGEISGGRIYDAHIAEIAVRTGAKIVVTENLRHFVSLEDQGVTVVAPARFLEQLAAG